MRCFEVHEDAKQPWVSGEKKNSPGNKNVSFTGLKTELRTLMTVENVRKQTICHSTRLIFTDHKVKHTQ
jgi:tRNA A37 threonylcarbamoyltransferase TsaD